MSKGGEDCLKCPIFDGSNYFAYRDEMESFLQAKDYYLWFSVERGPTIPMHEVVEDNKRVLKAKSKMDWDKDEVHQATTDQRAFHLLKKSIDASQVSVINACKSAKDIWDTLARTFEGNDQVKSSKRAILIREYELFEMHPNEKIHDMRNRLVSITNQLLNLGKETSNEEIVRKILYCLTPEWDTIKTAIIQAKDITKLSIGDLIASLEAHEAEHHGKKVIASTRKTLALKASSSSSKVESLKASSDDEDDVSSDDSLDMEEMTMFVRRFKKFMGKKGKKFPPKASSSNGGKKEIPKCFECDKPGHLRKDCYIFKKKKKNEPKKVLMGDDSFTWDNEEQEEEETTAKIALMEEDPYLCFMANEDDDEVVSFSYDELLEKYSELYNDSLRIMKNECKLKAKLKKLEEASNCNIVEHANLEKENIALKEEVACLKARLNENEHVKGENDSLVEQLDNLEKLHEQAKKEVESLSHEVSKKSEVKQDESLIKEVNELKAKNLNLVKSHFKFMRGNTKLEEILETQRPYLDRTGLGYNPPKKQKKYFRKKKKITCFCCHKEGHGVKECPLKKTIPKRTEPTPKVRRTWVPKTPSNTSRVDSHGPNKRWVPKALYDAYVGGKVSHDGRPT